MVLDIETYKDVEDANYIAWKIGSIASAPSNYKDPEKITKYINEAKKTATSKFSLSPLTGKIILIGVASFKPLSLSDDGIKLTTEYGDMYYKQFEGDEKELLKNFWDFFSSAQLVNGEPLVTYNGKKFDLPFIFTRTMLLLPGYQPKTRIKLNEYISKYNTDKHIDLYNIFEEGSLVEWSYKFNIANTLERDGDKIAYYYENNNMEWIKSKNLIDISQTLVLYKAIKNWL